MAGAGLRRPSRAMARLREGVLSLELAHVTRERGSLQAALAAETKAGQVAELAAEERRTEVDGLQAELRGREALAGAIRASVSWRVTAPLRALRTRGGAKPALASGLAASMQAAAGGSSVVARVAAVPRPRSILVVADFLPLFDQSAGGLRLRTLIQIMGRAGWHIRFGSLFAREDLPGALSDVAGRERYEAALRGDGVRAFLYGLPEIDRWLAAEGRELDWAFLSFPAVAVELLPLVRCRCPLAKVAYDMVDFHALRMERAAAVHGDHELAALAVRQRAVELSCVDASDVTVAVTDEERAAVLALAPKATVKVLPCVFDLPSGPSVALRSRKDLLFVGGFWHEPNADAVTWFVRHIWPLVRARVPDAVFRIVGPNAGADVVALGQTPGVDVVGFVADLAATFDRHRVFVAPLRFGAGMKGKVAQSLSFGLPVVGTAVAAEGMGLVDGRSILVADEPVAFADHVVRLMREDELWTSLAASGRAVIRDGFSVDVARKHLLALLDE